MSLPNLRHLVLSNITKSRRVLLPFLKLSGNKLEDLHLHGLVGNLSLEDIMNTCKNLQSLTVSQYHGHYLDHSMMDLPVKQQHLQRVLQSKPILNDLTTLTVVGANQITCSKDMLKTLLQSTRLSKLYLSQVKVLTDDIIWHVTLGNVTDITVTHISFLAAEAFTKWTSRENCRIQLIRIQSCEHINCDTLKIGAAKYNKPIIIEENSF